MFPRLQSRQRFVVTRQRLARMQVPELVLLSDLSGTLPPNVVLDFEVGIGSARLAPRFACERAAGCASADVHASLVPGLPVLPLRVLGVLARTQQPPLGPSRFNARCSGIQVNNFELTQIATSGNLAAAAPTCAGRHHRSRSTAVASPGPTAQSIAFRCHLHPARQPRRQLPPHQPLSGAPALAHGPSPNADVAGLRQAIPAQRLPICRDSRCVTGLRAVAVPPGRDVAAAGCNRCNARCAAMQPQVTELRAGYHLLRAFLVFAHGECVKHDRRGRAINTGAGTAPSGNEPQRGY
jgi:hypothetical protein